MESCWTLFPKSAEHCVGKRSCPDYNLGKERTSSLLLQPLSSLDFESLSFHMLRSGYGQSPATRHSQPLSVFLFCTPST